MKRILIEEKTLQLALVKAASQLGATQDEISHRIVEEKSGFLGFIGKKVSIEVWKKNAVQKRSLRPSDQARPNTLSPSEVSEVSNQVVDFCKTLLSKMMSPAPKVEWRHEGDCLNLNILDGDFAKQFGKDPKIAESLEHLFRKAPDLMKGPNRQELPFRLFVDANGVRKAREDELIGMAQDLSNKVHQNKKPIVLNYKSSYDRKVIHMALDDDDRVYTKSIGAGPHRKLMILPSRQNEANG